MPVFVQILPFECYCSVELHAGGNTLKKIQKFVKPSKEMCKLNPGFDTSDLKGLDHETDIFLLKAY